MQEVSGSIPLSSTSLRSLSFGFEAEGLTAECEVRKRRLPRRSREVTKAGYFEPFMFLSCR